MLRWPRCSEQCEKLFSAIEEETDAFPFESSTLNLSPEWRIVELKNRRSWGLWKCWNQLRDHMATDCAMRRKAWRADRNWYLKLVCARPLRLHSDDTARVIKFFPNFVDALRRDTWVEGSSLSRIGDNHSVWQLLIAIDATQRHAPRPCLLQIFEGSIIISAEPLLQAMRLKRSIYRDLGWRCTANPKSFILAP